MELLARPPKGTTIHLLRAMNSDRWSDASVRELKEACRASEDAGDQAGRSVYVELQDAGHWVHVDNPKGLVRLITPTLRSA